METRPRIGIAVEPYMARSAIHAALAQDERVEAVLFPRSPDVRLQARTADVDVVLVSQETFRPDVLVVRLSPAGVVEAHTNGAWRSLPYEGIEQLADLILGQLARRRHPSTVRPLQLVPAAAAT